MNAKRSGSRRSARHLPALVAIGIISAMIGTGSAQVSGPAPAQTQTGQVAVPATVMGAYCSKMVSPIYAHEADPDAKPATVVLEVIVNRQGLVHPIRAVSGDPMLRSAAMDAVRLWRYRPYMQNGQAIDVSTQINVNFVPGRPGGLITHPTGGG